MQTEPTAQARTARRAAGTAGWLAVLIGGGHVVAWVSGAMAKLTAGTIVMPTNAAVALLVCGFALILLNASRPDTARRRAAGACAALALLLGTATLTEHLFGWSLGIDELIASGLAGPEEHPNRMGPPASLSFALLGVALLLLSRGRQAGRERVLHEPLALVVLLLGLLETIGFLYGANPLHGVVRLTGIAWPTALSLLVLGVGVLCARPDEGLMSRVTADDAGGAITRVLLWPMILLIVVLGWLRLTGERLSWFDAPMGTSLMMLTFIVAFSSLVLFGGRRVSSSSAALRRSEEEARSQRGLLDGVMSATDVMMAYLDADFHFVWVNAAYAASCRMAPEELPGLNHFALYPHAENEAIFRQVRDTGQSVFYKDKPFEYADQPERGRTYWDWSLVPAKDAAGKVVGLVLSLRETTKYKLAEDALRHNEERLQRLVEASTQSIGETTLEGILQTVSDAARDVTGARYATVGHGYSNGQFLVGAASRAADAPSCPEGTGFSIERGGVYLDLVHGADTIRLTDAELRSHSRWWGLPEKHVPMRGLLGVRLVKRDGKANGMILVTDKQLGEFTAEDESALRQLAAIGSLGLQQAETRQELEEADRRKNQFLAVLSHELRNPLAPIRSALHILARVPPGDEAANQATAVIDRQVAQLSRLVDDLLDMTRITRGRIQLQREPLDLVALVHRTADDHRSFFSTGGVELEVDAPKEALWVEGDAQRLAQAIGNLLHNAAKFTERGGRAVIQARKEEAAGAAIISVRDTGMGISPSTLPHLFEPFIQADTTLDRARGGLGLGLSLVKSLIEMHGGAVQARSDGAGKGAELTIRLPLQGSPSVAPAPPARADHQPRRVLIIEDNVDAAHTLHLALGLAGHQVAVAYTGAEGIARARQFNPDVILCDIGLPGMDGYDVARVLRSDDRLRRAYLVALTGYALPGDVTKAHEAGFDLHVAKPLSPAKLEELLAALGTTQGTVDGARAAETS